MKDALGLIEIKGLATAILVADTMVKTANVSILEVEKTRGLGWMTVKIVGDVAAVKAALEAGKQVGEAYGHFVTRKVIPRPSEGVERVFCQPPSSGREEGPAPASKPDSDSSSAEKNRSSQNAAPAEAGEKAPTQEKAAEVVPVQEKAVKAAPAEEKTTKINPPEHFDEMETKRAVAGKSVLEQNKKAASLHVQQHLLKPEPPIPIILPEQTARGNSIPAPMEKPEKKQAEKSRETAPAVPSKAKQRGGRRKGQSKKPPLAAPVVSRSDLENLHLEQTSKSAEKDGDSHLHG